MIDTLMKMLINASVRALSPCDLFVTVIASVKNGFSNVCTWTLFVNKRDLRIYLQKRWYSTIQSLLYAILTSKLYKFDNQLNSSYKSSWAIKCICFDQYELSCDVIVTNTKKPRTRRCRYNAVNFLPNPHKRHPIARPWGQGMGCCQFNPWLSSASVTAVLCRIQRYIILDRVITALGCISFKHNYKPFDRALREAILD